MKRTLEINAEMCATCPFRPGVPEKYACLRDQLAQSALTEATRICHQTGKDNAFHRRTGKPEAGCRGARNVQLNYFASTRFIEAPTDEAWEKKCAIMGIKPNQHSARP